MRRLTWKVVWSVSKRRGKRTNQEIVVWGEIANVIKVAFVIRCRTWTVKVVYVTGVEGIPLPVTTYIRGRAAVVRDLSFYVGH